MDNSAESVARQMVAAHDKVKLERLKQDAMLEASRITNAELPYGWSRDLGEAYKAWSLLANNEDNVMLVVRAYVERIDS